MESWTSDWITLVGGYVDFWCVILVHRLVYVAIIFIVRYFCIVRPWCIRIHSAKLCICLE